MLSSRNPHACYLQNLNDDGKLHNGLTASLCSRAAPPQKHKLIAKRGGENSIPLIKQIQQNAQNAISTNVSVGCHRQLWWTLPLSFLRVQLCFQVSEICIICWKSSSVQTFRMNFKHIWCTFWCTVSLASVDRTIDFEVVPVGIFQRTLLWRTFYSLHGLFNNILLNNSGIELYMLILPAFIHARYYIRNSISAEPCQTIVSAFFYFFFWSLQLSTIWLYLHVREKWRNHWPEFGLMVLKWYFWAILWCCSLQKLQNSP